MLRYVSTGEVHKDFHGLTCATLHYLADNYGENLGQLRRIFMSERDSISEYGCAALVYAIYFGY